jgi:hypothetical protein
MTIIAEHPPGVAGAARRDLLGGKIYPLDSTPRVRLQRLAKQIHSLGPQALSYLFADLARGRDLLEALEDYGRLAPYAALIEAYATPPSLFVIDGGRQF